MIPTCPKCKAQYEERDNFCIDCGKDLTDLRKIIIKEKIISRH